MICLFGLFRLILCAAGFCVCCVFLVMCVYVYVIGDVAVGVGLLCVCVCFVYVFVYVDVYVLCCFWCEWLLCLLWFMFVVLVGRLVCVLVCVLLVDVDFVVGVWYGCCVLLCLGVRLWLHCVDCACCILLMLMLMFAVDVDVGVLVVAVCGAAI